MTPRVSIIVPCRNEEAFIGACLESILATAYPRDDLEILVVDGLSDDRTADVVRLIATRHPNVHLLENPQRIVPAALNIGIRAARGDVVVRMDAHVEYPPEYLPRLVAALDETGADNVGGRVVTLATAGTPVARAIALALSHPFGVGNSYFRIATTESRWVDTVPFGCYRRGVFERVGMFDEELVRNQDDEFNHRLIRAGGRVRLCADVVSHYYARGTYRAVARMFYQYGCYKPLVARKVGRVLTLRQLVPAALVAWLVAGGALALVWPLFAALWGAGLLCYAIAVAAAALPVARAHGLKCAFALAAAFPLVHLSYGAGFLRGVWGLVTPGQAPWRDPAAVPLSR